MPQFGWARKWIDVHSIHLQTLAWTVSVCVAVATALQRSRSVEYAILVERATLWLRRYSLELTVKV